MQLYIGLVHYPVYNKNGQTIASAVTPVDLHDLARLAATYGVNRLFIITPLEDQQGLAKRIRRHWTEGFGAGYNPDRKKAMELVAVVSSLEEAMGMIAGLEDEPPLLVATDARMQKNRMLSFETARKMIRNGKGCMLIFGTAWGLSQSVLESADHVLEPIAAQSEYNHLSVRTAAAIILDRLTG